MNLYLIIFLLVAAGAVLERFRPQDEKKIYWICWGLMTAVLCLRFGQGTDYATYHAVYDSQPLIINWEKGYFLGVYPEIGWRVLTALSRGILHLPFWGFTAVLGLMCMLLLHRFLSCFVDSGKILGLTIAYPVLFIVYLLSGIRQGLAACVLLGLALPFYMQKKWGRYVLCVFLAASFHKVGLSWLVLIPVYYLKLSWMLVIAALAAAGGFLLQIEAVETLIWNLLPFYNYHFQQFLLEGSISLLAVGERVLSFLIVFFLYCKMKEATDSRIDLLMKAYTCGVIFYVLLCGNSYYASRYAVIFKMLEIVLVPVLTRGKELWQRVGYLFFLALSLLMGIKNMNAMLREGGYDTSRVHIWNYPYVSVFNRADIDSYTAYTQTYTEQYGYDLNDQELWRLEE